MYAPLFALYRRAGPECLPPTNQGARMAYGWQWGSQHRDAFAATAYLRWKTLSSSEPPRDALADKRELRTAALWYRALPQTLQPCDWAGKQNELDAVRDTIEQVFGGCSGGRVATSVRAALVDNDTRRLVARLPTAVLKSNHRSLVGSLARFSLAQPDGLAALSAGDTADNLSECEAVFVRVTPAERQKLQPLFASSPGYRVYVLPDVARLLRAWTDGGACEFGNQGTGDALNVELPPLFEPLDVPLDAGWTQVLVRQNEPRECAVRILAAAVLEAAVPCHKHYRGTLLAVGALLNLSACGTPSDGEL